jgi:hypothetical protein
MGYKDYSSNLDIRPRRINVLDHFPPGECLSTSTLIIHLAESFSTLLIVYMAIRTMSFNRTQLSIHSSTQLLSSGTQPHQVAQGYLISDT